jgi:hypothetical protein
LSCLCSTCANRIFFSATGSEILGHGCVPLDRLELLAVWEIDPEASAGLLMRWRRQLFADYFLNSRYPE